jgi:hypothetical protein
VHELLLFTGGQTRHELKLKITPPLSFSFCKGLQDFDPEGLCFSEYLAKNKKKW